MSRRVDRLFEGKVNPPLRRNAIVTLLWIGLPLDVLGVITCTGVIGMGVTLWALHVIDRERLRVEVGDLALEHSDELEAWRRKALAGLGFCAAGFVLQIWLLSTGFYERLLS